MTAKFSTYKAYRLKLLLLYCLLFINYHAISQADSLQKDSSKIFKEDTTQKKEQIIYHFKLYDDIMPAAGRLVKNAIKQAEAVNADIIIMELNTYGGRVDIADTIKTYLLNTEIKTVSYIVNNALSAGAFISIACDSIYMKEDATIGAVTVVSGTDGTQMPDKYQSVMRAKMRSVAELNGRDPDIAEAMVDDRVAIPGIIDSGKVLAFTAAEALKHNFNDGIVENLEDVIKLLKIDNYKVVEHQLSVTDKIIGFLLNPIVNSVLMLLIFGGIYFELQTPGIGFPLAAALIGATLFFAPLYLEGLAASWEVVVFFVGIAFIAIELFVLPGFGAAGALGIIMIVGSLTLSLVQNDVFDFTFTGWDEIANALFRVVATLIIGLGTMFALGGSFLKSKAFLRLTLQDEQRSDLGYTIKLPEIDIQIGLEGKTLTDLKTSGKVEMPDGEIYDAISEGGWIDKGTTVKVLKIEGNTLIVRKVMG
jgi:membrane-bound serine protease (ClpP class)